MQQIQIMNYKKSTTEKVLKELGADTKPTILVYNKIDRLELDIYPKIMMI